MRLLVVTLACLFALFVLAASAGDASRARSFSVVQPGANAIHFTDLLVETHRIKSGCCLVSTFLLYNRSITGHSIGHSVLFCTGLGKGGVLGNGQSYCRNEFFLARGALLAEGIVNDDHVFYVMAVTGGTGIYANVGAGVVASSLLDMNPRADTVIMQLYASDP